MKLSNIFKKEKSTKVKSNSQTLDKKQLEKVAGGAETPKVIVVSSGTVDTLNNLIR